MKNAEEMFEKLGYTKYGVVRNDGETRHVNIGYVHKDEGTIVLDIHFYDTGILIWKDPMVQAFVNKEEVLAIVQQCRELGWLE